MGGELGTRLANQLGRRPDGRGRHGARHRSAPAAGTGPSSTGSTPATASGPSALIRDFAPTALVHLGVYEPYARSTPALARSSAPRPARSPRSTRRRRRRSPRPHRRALGHRDLRPPPRARRSAPTRTCAPTRPAPFGHQLLHVERVCVEGGLHAGRPGDRCCASPRWSGPSFPSPLGRYLRMPAVPVPGARRPAVLGAAPGRRRRRRCSPRCAGRHDGPVNVVGRGAVTASQAARLGRRLPVPTWALGWQSARLFSELAGAPIPDHVHELLTRGRVADGSRAGELLGVRPAAHDARGRARSSTPGPRSCAAPAPAGGREAA